MPAPTASLQTCKLPPSSMKWLARQFRDPYVKARLSHPHNYRSRAAFKLLELDARYKFLSSPHVHTVVDLGAAPGGWSQVVAGKLGWLDSRKEQAMPVMPNLPVERKQSKGTLRQRAKYATNDTDTWSSASSEAPRNPNFNSPYWHEDRMDPLDYLNGTGPLPTSPTSSHISSIQPITIRPSTGVDVHTNGGRGMVIAVDLLPMEPIPGVTSLQMDFLAPETSSRIDQLLCSPICGAKSSLFERGASNEGGRPQAQYNDEVSATLSSTRNPLFATRGKVDVILSDMSPSHTGLRSTSDIESTLELCQAVFDFTKRHLKTQGETAKRRGGALLLKHFAHPLLEDFRKSILAPHFAVVVYCKPPSSRSESSEGYWLATGFRGSRPRSKSK